MFTLVLVGATVASLVRWIHHITKLGRMDDTIKRLERAVIEALRKHRRAPHLGGVAWHRDADPPDADAVPVLPESAGYVKHFDTAALAACLEPTQRAWILARPGAFVGPNRPLALVARTEPGEPIAEGALASMRKAWLLGDTRNFDQDPRFGLCVFAEVASKALSPSVNDVGTAIGVLGRLARVLGALDRDAGETDERVGHGNILIPPISAHDLLRDAFRPIARDGAGAVELGLRLQATLSHVSRLNPPEYTLTGDLGEAAAAVAHDALLRARRALASPADVAEIEAAAAHLLSQHEMQAR